MNDNLLWMIQSMTIEQLKKEIDKNTFVDKNLKDFNEVGYGRDSNKAITSRN